MNIGLVRHFRVDRGYPKKFINSEELMNWVVEYDSSDVIEEPVNLYSIKWKRCISSDLPRAIKTAQKVSEENILYLEELREIKMSPFFRSNINLPIYIHMLFIRIAWFLNHKSQSETKDEVMERINRVLDTALSHNENVLIVGHGGIMIFIRKELVKRGFAGPKFRKPKNGVVYIYKKNDT